jgi:predicted nucleic acid-binding Zn finger protein
MTIRPAQDNDSNWHLDKKVPIYVGAIKTRGDDNERRISALESQKVSERLSSVEAQLTDAKSLLLRMDSKIDRLNERGKE